MCGCVWGELCVMRGERVYCTHMSGTQPNTPSSSPGREGVWTPNEDMNPLPKISHGLNSCRGRWPHSCVRCDVIAAQTDGWVQRRGVDVHFHSATAPSFLTMMSCLNWRHWGASVGCQVHRSLHSQLSICCYWISFSLFCSESTLLFSSADLLFFCGQQAQKIRLYFVVWWKHCTCGSCCRVFGFKTVALQLDPLIHLWSTEIKTERQGFKASTNYSVFCGEP